MSNSKFLGEAGWKDIAAKNNVKDNGLLKKLADIKRVGDDKHDEALKLLDEALKLAGQLRKDKKTAPAAGKYLDEVVAAAETAVREVGKAKAEADKAAKAKAEAEKKAQAEAAKKADDDDDDEDAESPELLTTKLKPLLRLVAKGETMHTLVAKSGKQVVVMLSRKPIPPARRKMLADQLGGGSTKYYPGHCGLEAGATTFVLKAEVAGTSKLIKAALLGQTGLRLNKVKCRGEDGDDDDGDDDGGAPGAEGAELGEKPDEAGADGLALAGLGTSRREWGQARAHAVGELTRLKQILQDDYRDAADEQAALAAALQRVDATIAAIDEELTDRLDQVINAQPAQRAEVAAAAKAALMRIVNLVGSDQILQSIDGNELAPDMVVAEPLRARLQDIAASLS